jgi:GntR family histidine utilization transcriptional repressor
VPSPDLRIEAARARWGCARATVGKAISALVAEGMVTRNRRAGTVVASPRIQSAVLTIPDIRAETEARGRVYGYHLQLDELRAPCCVHLGEEGHHLGESRFLRTLHRADGHALMLEDRHVFLDAVPEARTADFVKEPPANWLTRHVPWTEAEHRIAAVPAEAGISKALELSNGTPCLLIERRTWRGHETLTIVRQWFRGDAFDLTARFKPSG